VTVPELCDESEQGVSATAKRSDVQAYYSTRNKDDNVDARERC
jgi:hypothetical protein